MQLKEISRDIDWKSGMPAATLISAVAACDVNIIMDAAPERHMFFETLKLKLKNEKHFCKLS